MCPEHEDEYGSSLQGTASDDRRFPGSIPAEPLHPIQTKQYERAIDEIEVPPVVIDDGVQRDNCNQGHEKTGCTKAEDFASGAYQPLGILAYGTAAGDDYAGKAKH